MFMSSISDKIRLLLPGIAKLSISRNLSDQLSMLARTARASRSCRSGSIRRQPPQMVGGRSALSRG